ncbi:MAG: TonB-dependent receptor [Lewinellaceae bacterium]|nr:TonB-dependent receptor [Lewinellaceae bacterium]
MKKTLLLLAFFSVAGLALSQSNSIFGRAVDGASQEPLIGAHVQLLQLPDSTARASTTTNERGGFMLQDIAPGNYVLKISYLGYETYTKPVEKDNGPLRLGQLAMTEEALNLEQVQVVERLPAASQQGDTTQFNAGAFKVNPDANAEDLIRKMPGVVVEGGKVQAQGEDVQQVLVDGKPFFGNDPMTALRNLPAEVIDKIQVFDQLSEQAQFSGFNTGETTKGINIITKPSMRNGQFGRLYAGYGTDDRYQAGGIVNFFKGDTRVSVIGQSNNVNQQNFSTEDLVGITGSSGRGGRGGGGGGRPGGGSVGDFLVGQQDGISTTHALGLNYMDKWGKKIEVSGSYFFNLSDNEASQSLFQNYVSDADFGQTYDEQSLSKNRNTNHRFNFRLEYDIDSTNSILVRPRFSFQQNDGRETTTGLSILGSGPLSSTNYRYSPELSGLDFSNSLLWRHRFGKAGRTFSINLNTGYNDKEGERYLLSENTIFNGNAVSDTLDQFSDLFSDGWNLEASANYTEPLGKRSQLQFNYEWGYEKGDSEQETYDFEESSQKYSGFNQELSNTFNSTYVRQEAGTGYSLRGEKGSLNARVSLQWSELESEQVFPEAGQISRSFFNVLPSLFYRYSFSRQENLRIGYRPRTSPPSITQLQDVVDNSNPLRLRMGNPELEQSYSHRLFARYSKTNPEKSSVFYAMLSGQLTDNYVANSTFTTRRDTLIADGILLAQGGQLIRSVNLDGYWNVRGFVTIGRPLRLLKSNLNVNLSADYTQQPGEVNGSVNYARNTRLGLGLVLSSNISKNVDFTISSQSNYGTADNTLSTALNTDYFNQSSRVGLNLIFLNGFVFNSELNHQLYTGLSEGFDQNFWLWSLSLGRKLFKNQRGEVKLTAFDLLEQNNSIQRNVTEAYIEDIRTAVLQRYLMLTFTYNLRNFGGGTPPQQEERRGFGPPPGGHGF